MFDKGSNHVRRVKKKKKDSRSSCILLSLSIVQLDKKRVNVGKWHNNDLFEQEPSTSMHLCDAFCQKSRTFKWRAFVIGMYSNLGCVYSDKSSQIFSWHTLFALRNQCDHRVPPPPPHGAQPNSPAVQSEVGQTNPHWALENIPLLLPCVGQQHNETHKAPEFRDGDLEGSVLSLGDAIISEL